MNAAALAVWLELTRDLEGVCPWLYLDVAGLVTVGVGNLVDPPGRLWMADLDWRIGGRAATHEEVWEAWGRVKQRQDWKGRGGGQKCWGKLTAPRATTESIDRLVSKTAGRFFGILISYFRELPGWPDDAQIALMLMAWAMGPDFPHKYPKFSAACRALDFASWVTLPDGKLELAPNCAAAQAHMSEVGQNPSFIRRNAIVKDRLITASQALGQ